MLLASSIAIPILSNIMLHELDRWVEDTLIPWHTRGKQRRASPDYKALVARRSYAKKIRLCCALAAYPTSFRPPGRDTEPADKIGE